VVLISRRSSEIDLSLLFSIFAVIILFTTSCKKNENESKLDSSKPPINSTLESEKILNYLISSYGIPKDSIVETPDFFYVEGDIAFPKGKEFWDNYTLKNEPSVLNKHYRTAFLVTGTRTIICTFTSSVPLAWKQAYRSAFSVLNGLNLRVKFAETSGYCPTNGIIIDYVYLGFTNPIATTFFPTNSGNPGYISKINNSIYFNLSASLKVYSALHELLHALGMSHADSGVLSGGSQIITTNSACNNNIDYSSILKPVIGTSYNGLSNCDILAIKKLYK
jgi:hypothetical protein